MSFTDTGAAASRVSHRRDGAARRSAERKGADRHADKIRLVDMLSACGFERIEVTSFVSPKWVPQLADAAEVMAGIARRPGVRYAALTPNMKGFEAALAAGADEVAIFASASEGFSRAQHQLLDRREHRAVSPGGGGGPAHEGIAGARLCQLRGANAPMTGAVAPESAAGCRADSCSQLGCYEISLGDTIGRGTPEAVDRMLAAVLAVIAGRASWLGIFTTRRAGRSTISAWRSITASGSSMRRSAGSAAAPMRQVPRAMSIRCWSTAMLKGRGFVTGLNEEALEAASVFARGLRSLRMTYETIRVAVDDRGVATLTLARPEKHNAHVRQR